MTHGSSEPSRSSSKVERLSRRRFIGRAGSSGARPDRPRQRARRLRRRRGRGREGRGLQGQGRRRSATRRPRSATGRSPTGRSTSTRRSSRTSTRSSAARSSTSRRSTTTSSSSGRSASSCSPSKPIGRDIVTLTDYMAARWVRLGYAEPIDKKNVPNFAQPRRQPQDDQLRPQARVHAAVAVRRDGHRLQHQEDRARAQERQGPLRPEVQGQGHDALRSPTTPPRRCCWATASTRRRPTLDQMLGAIEKIDKANQRGPVPPLHRQRLHAAAGQGRHLGRARLLRRHGAAAVRQPGPALRLLPRRATPLFTDNMMMPAKASSTPTRPRR